MATLTLDTDSKTIYTCSTCAGRFQQHEMMKHRRPLANSNITYYYGPRCKPCESARKRAVEKRLRAVPRDEAGNIVEPVLETDPGPIRLLGELLREDRDRWTLPFDDAWDEDVQLALRELPAAERNSWREVLESTRPAWEAAWHRQLGPGHQLSPTLLEALSGSRAAYDAP